jgi:protein tyrosine phosphatase (PTP) superfamily phosphohydrolase (DUF442 family)
MRRHLYRVLLAFGPGLLLLSGCSCLHSCDWMSRKFGRGRCDSCDQGGPLPPRMNPVPAPPAPAEAGAPLPPGAGAPQPPGPPVFPGGETPAPGPSPGPSPAPSPAPSVRLLPPEDLAGGPDSSRFSPGETREPPGAVPSRPPSVSEEREREAPLPVDIPGFAIARPRVASGQKPFPDGIDWLKARGYRTALHVHAPGEDTAAVRRQFERRGLRYLSLEVSPETLSEETLERFNRLVTDPANLPLFVFDRDGSLAGGLWYLHFRLHEKTSPEKARAEAARLGFRQEDKEHLDMWLAVQKLVEKLKK